MVSILGDYNYTFPPKQELKLRLKDMLEDNVDEKYYLSDKMINYCLSSSSGGFDRSVNFINNLNNQELASTITTKAGNRATDNFIVSDCVGTYQYSKSDKFMHGKDRFKLGKDVSDTLMTTPKEGVVTIGNYSPSGHNASRIVDSEHSAPTVMENHGTITAILDTPKVLCGVGEKKSNNGTQWYQQDRIYDDKIAISVTTSFNPYYKNDLRIRKLTPYECFALMGVKKEDYLNCAKNQSDSSLYHLAGDSIVVNVLMAIFKEML